MTTTTERERQRKKTYFFAGFCGSPPEKPSEGRHYREFFHEGAQEFSIDFFFNFGDFLEPGGAFGNLGGQPGHRTSIFVDF